MAFSLNGTHIEGSTFNNVSGNMLQVYNSHVVHVGPRLLVHDVREDRPLIAGVHDFPAAATTHGSIGPIRTQRALRNQDTRPYAHLPSVNPHDHRRVASSQPHMSGVGSGGPSEMYPVIEYAAPADPQTRMAFYSPQLHPPSGNYPSSAPAPAMADEINGGRQFLTADPVHPSGLQWPMQNENIFGTSASGSGNISNTFNSVGGDFVTSYGESGIDLLYRHVAMEALHNSGERFEEPACHPGTRTAILEQLGSWSTDTRPESTIMWLHGCAGAGKSAIVQMFAGNIHREGRLGASFFFKRGHMKRGTWHSLIPTLSYQLAMSVPALLLPIQQAVEHDKLVVGRALTASFEQLLVEPFKNVQELQHIPVIVLDGLDECADHKVQQQILRLFIRAIRDHQLPIRLLIASRPEPHLREILEKEDTFAICRHSALSADHSAFDDIRKYFLDEFSRIQSESMDRGINLGSGWPSPDAVNQLVRTSSATFIYATTVIRFVDDEYHHPADRLQSVLDLDPQSTAPLDDLYTQILSVVPQEQAGQQLRILHIIWRNILVDPEELDILLNLRAGTCWLILRCLHSLLDVPRIRTRFGGLQVICTLHASLGDYLSDSRRSGQWCVSSPWLEQECLHSILHLLSTPAQTESQRDFYRSTLYELSEMLSKATPSGAIIDLLRNGNVQNNLFLRTDCPWPERGARYPADLDQLWEDLSTIKNFIYHLSHTIEARSVTLRYDSIYTEVFSQNPDLCLIAQWRIAVPDMDITYHSSFFGLTPAIFRPLLNFPLPFPAGGSPIDFLANPRRAGELYCEPGSIAIDMMLRWIKRVKQTLAGGPWEPHEYYLEEIRNCGTSRRLLRELETLNLSDLCRQMAIDPGAHANFHGYVATETNLCAVLDWLRSFPEHPLSRRVIAFWERQKSDLLECQNDHGWKFQ
ncbi:hypothetical protein DFH09DRAFT_139072 [Mycena vulgaris]|nr:hypothetical protein DFH09DRAFT_139072 [Mycena vulgaris]